MNPLHESSTFKNDMNRQANHSISKSGFDKSVYENNHDDSSGLGFHPKNEENEFIMWPSAKPADDTSYRRDREVENAGFNA